MLFVNWCVLIVMTVVVVLGYGNPAMFPQQAQPGWGQGPMGGYSGDHRPSTFSVAGPIFLADPYTTVSYGSGSCRTKLKGFL
jgi:hypothetical protein